MNVRNLPGESARASLKQDAIETTRCGLELAWAGSPGRIGPGLIEATFAVRLALSDGQGPISRAKSARASLKPPDGTFLNSPLSPIASISRANRPGPH